MKIPSYQGVKASSLSVTASHLDVTLEDGRMLRLPISLFPKLKDATSRQLAHWEWIGEGIGIEWPDLDEHLSIAGFLQNTPYFASNKKSVLKQPVKQVSIDRRSRRAKITS